MVQVGLLLSDVPKSVTPAQQFKDILRIVEAAEDNGFSYICIGQHFLYGDLRWLQPVPLLARLAAHVAPTTRLVTQIMIAPCHGARSSPGPPAVPREEAEVRRRSAGSLVGSGS